MTDQHCEDISAAPGATETAGYDSRWTKENALLPSLRSVAGLTVRSNDNEYDARGQWIKTTAELTLESRPPVLAAVVGFVRESLQLLKFADQQTIIRMCVAITESLDNALYHGNLELCSDLREQSGSRWESAIAERRGLSPYKERQIHVRTELSKLEMTVSIRDEGPGFNPATLPDPTDPEHLGCPCGRGVFLIRSFVDEVRYNDKGNEITLVKRVG